MSKSPERQGKVGSDLPPLGLDEDFDQALDEFVELAETTLERILVERLAAIEERLKGIAADRSAASESLLTRATSAEAELAVLKSQLAMRKLGEVTNEAPHPTPKSRPRSSRGRTGFRLTGIPENPNLHDVIQFLMRQGFEVDNKRPQGGGLWVYSDKADFAKAASALKAAGIGVRFHPEGRKRRPGPQYEIDPFKVLPE